MGVITLLTDNHFHSADHHLEKLIDKKFRSDDNFSTGGTFSIINRKAAINLYKYNEVTHTQKEITNQILKNQDEFILFAQGQESKEITQILDSFFGN